MTASKTILKCRHCSKEFKYDSERRRHEQSHVPQFQCKVCTKNFSFISALRRHEKQHERTGSVQCTECGRGFRDSILLKRHTKYAHGGTFTCPKCNAAFSSEAALSTHMKTHKSESERRYQCSFKSCTKKFNFAHHLKHHELTHTNTKQHYCKICNKGFIQFHHLKTHLKFHSADCSLWCSFPGCYKKFATEYAKKRHFAKYHIKTDSGITSDSNSTWDLTRILKNETGNDFIEKHTLSCIQNLKKEYVTADQPGANSQNIAPGGTSTDSHNNIVDDEVHNCKLVLGSCIMSEKGEKCVCARIPKTIDEDYDFTPIDNELIINMSKLGSNTGCKCPESRHIKNEGTKQDAMPEIEYKTDGTVKIKDTFDIDFPPVVPVKVEVNSITNALKFVPYYSCKAVLGNCIVSGNGTMGDGCLCAKMILDDDQVTSQEIDDITPHPKDELFCD